MEHFQRLFKRFSFEVSVIMGFALIIALTNGCEENELLGDGGPDAETDHIAINFELSAKVENSAGGGVNGTLVKLEGDKWVWNSDSLEYKFHHHFEVTLTTQTAWWFVIPYPGYTDAFKFGYNIGKVGSHQSYVVLHATIVGYESTRKFEYFYHSNAQAAGDGATVEKTLVLAHPDY